MVDNHFDTVTDLIQSSLSVVNSKYQSKGLSVNPVETEVVLFTRKRKTDGVVRFTYQGVRLNLTEEVKYLGIIILDDKLTWKAHVETQLKKRLKTVDIPDIGRQDLGLLPKMTQWLYMRVIVPGITYAAVVWWDRIEVASARSGRDHQQRAACVIITWK